MDEDPAPRGLAKEPTGRLDAPPATDPATGLDALAVSTLRDRFGPNQLPAAPRERLISRLFRHLREPTSLLLIAAAAVAGIGLGERLDALAILAIVALNASIGVIQEGRAARALEALRDMETPSARVLREGAVRLIPAPEIVPGDLVILSAGDRVPADLRILEASAMEVDESILTGESLPVAKEPGEPVEGRGLGDRPWAALSGTLVTRGSGRGLAVATGPRTELGGIAAHLAARETRTPLQEELAALSARLGAIAVLVAVVVFGLILLQTGVGAAGIERAFLAAVALAVAAVPEGLATVVTVALALGVHRMARRGAIVRRLPAVETLGSTTVILTDKTGTLTENRMRLHAVAPADGPVLLGAGFSPGSFPELAEALILCNDATSAGGDPMDVALLEALDEGLVERTRADHPRLASLPFESARRRMTTLHRDDGRVLVLVKGAPEVVLPLCTRRRGMDGEEAVLEHAKRSALVQMAAELAGGGSRVLAVAERSLPEPPESLGTAEADLTFLGLAGMRDAIRVEAPGAVGEARAAGIRVVMVTGDHPGTAGTVAREVGLMSEDQEVLTGPDIRLTGMPSDPLQSPVYARMDPDQKLELVEAVRKAGEVAAVTGDGVNDAPALRNAHIGVAMGRSGSDVAREAADLVVTDDNLATIVDAVREGRGIYDNIRKVVDYLIAGNLSEISVVVATLLIFPEVGVPLLPLQLLWVNLLTDGLPAIGLGVDRVDEGIMARPPRPPKERILGGRKLGRLLFRALLMAAGSVGALAMARFAFEEPWAHARAVMFSVLVMAHLLSAFVARLPTRGFNPAVIGAVIAGMVLQLTIILWPAARAVFHTAPLTAREWLLVLVAGTLPVAMAWAIERRRDPATIRR
jgi:Ca2+-transporting ATPase